MNYILRIAALLAGLSTLMCTQNRTEEACTLMGCEDRLILELQNGDWVAGSYSVQVQTLSGDTSCTVNLGEDGIPGEYRVEGIPCEGPATVLIGEGRLVVLGAPETASVTLTNESTGASATEEYSPRYEEFYPNGEDCSPVCLVADGKFHVESVMGALTSP